MRKITFFILTICTVFGSTTAQRITQMTVTGIPSLVPFAAFNPTNNSTAALGDGQIIYPASADLSKVAVTLNCGTTAAVTEPVTLPTDWSSTVSGIKVTNSATPNDWAIYNITPKKIIPASLPFTLTTGTGNFSSDSWTPTTVGWAGACIDKAQTLIRFGSANRSFVVGFSDTPDSLIYTAKYLTTAWNTSNVFDVDGSADGIVWTSINQYNSTNAMPIASPTVIAKIKLNNSNFRYIRWIYSTRVGTANISLENIRVTKLINTAALTPEEQKVNVILNSTKNNLQIFGSEQIKEISLYNLTGNLIFRRLNPETIISIPTLPAGIYISKILFNSANSFSSKLIKN